MGLRALAGAELDQSLGNAQQGAGDIRALPFGRRSQFLRCQFQSARPHLLAGMRYLQLDHLPAHPGIDRIDLEQPVRKAGCLLVSLPRYRRLGCLQQQGAVVREALDRFVHQAVPILEP